LTRRNNADRVGAPQPDAPNIPENLSSEQHADPLSFVVPTEYVTLPSQGQYYPEGHPLHNEEAVEIKFMTAKEEDLLTSKSLLERGIVLDRLIDSLLVNKRLQSRDLLVCDRNAILIQARSSGYGSDYTTQIVCKQCTATDSYHYDLNSAAVEYPLEPAALSEMLVEHIGHGLFRATIPMSNVEVTFRLLNGHDERRMTDNSERRKKKKQDDRLITDQLKLMLVSVMGHEEPDLINRFVESLPLRDSRFLRKLYETVTPSIELRQEFVCAECGHEDDIKFPFTTDFFWPDI
jgi:hypothetical protein